MVLVGRGILSSQPFLVSFSYFIATSLCEIVLGQVFRLFVLMNFNGVRGLLLLLAATTKCNECKFERELVRNRGSVWGGGREGGKGER